MHKFLLLLSAALCLNSAHAIVGGLPADGVRFQAVRHIDIRDNGWWGGGTCSGTMIGNGMLITAAHCVINKNNKPFKSLTIGRFKDDPNGRKAESASVDALYDPRVVGAHDIAIVYIDDGEDDGVTARLPIQYLYEVYKARHPKETLRYPKFLESFSANQWRRYMDNAIDRSTYNGANAFIVGFGLICPTSSCKTLPDHALYIGKFIHPLAPDLSCSGGDFSFMQPQPRFCISGSEQGTVTAPGAKLSLIEGGDSGGPVFAFDKSGNAILIGVNSFGRDDDSMSGFMNLAETEYADFIRATINTPVSPISRNINFYHGTDTMPSTQTNSEIYESARAFLNDVLASFSVPVGEVASETRKIYRHGELRFYGADHSIDFVVKDRLKSARRWPNRSYTLGNLLPISCGDSQCTVTADVDWEVSDQRGGQKSGRARYTWTFERQDDGHFIVFDETSAKSEN